MSLLCHPPLDHLGLEFLNFPYPHGQVARGRRAPLKCDRSPTYGQRHGIEPAPMVSDGTSHFLSIDMEEKEDSTFTDLFSHPGTSLGGESMAA